jgi:HAD superfamily hydrolase (TIGR01509 family)
MTLKALIFDVDGTLAETEGVHLQAFNAAFKDAGLDWVWSVELYKVLLGTTGGKERMLTYVRDHLGLEAAPWADRIPTLHAQKTKRYVDIVKGGGLELRPGVQALMDAGISAGLTLAIATTTSRPNVDALCRSIWGVKTEDIFKVVACGDEVSNKKPAPDVFNLAIKRLKLPASVCIGFEDSYNGMLSSLCADLATVVVPSFYTGVGDFSMANLVADSYENIDMPRLTQLLN